MYQFKYTLVAANQSGAIVRKRANTAQEALSLFDAEYNRLGWVISIFNNKTEREKQIKKTFR